MAPVMHRKEKMAATQREIKEEKGLKVKLLPMLRAMLGDPAPTPRPLRARLAVDVAANGPRDHYMRGRLLPGEGLPRIEPFARQDSALIGILTEADALLIRPMGDGPQAAGTEVDYLPL